MDEAIDKKADIRPMITEDELGASKKQEIIMRHLIGDMEKYNFDAIYQRGSDIWPLQMKQNLIVSVLCGVPVGCVHVVQHKTKIDSYLVCDGKQRWETIKDFKEGKFNIAYKGKIYTFDSLKEIENQHLYRKFMEYTWDTRLWPWMSVLKQRDLFERINAMSSLNPAERLYCSNFFTKILLIYTHKMVKKFIGDRMGKEFFKDERFVGLTWCHNLLHLCFGKGFVGNYTQKHLSSKTRKESAEYINNIFLDHIGEEMINAEDDDSLISEDLLKKVSMLSNFELLEKTLGVFKLALTYAETIKKKPDKNALKEMIVWLLNNINKKTITAGQIKEHKAKFFKVFDAYHKTRAQKGLTVCQTTLATHQKSVQYLDELLIATGVDTLEKDKELTERQKQDAIARCDGTCPRCKCKLTDDNMEIDHVYCSSKFGETKGVCLCKPCNQRKSDWTPDEFRSYSEYIASTGKD